ncbi:hypothetical protein ACWEQL_00315 [Kitasatospora sp. NPDC004240]
METEFKPGDRVCLARRANTRSTLTPGATGTVRHWNPHPLVRQLDVSWDFPHQRHHEMLDLTDNGDRVEKL